MIENLTHKQSIEWFEFISQPIDHFHVVGNDYLVHSLQNVETRFSIFPNGKLIARYQGKSEIILCNTPHKALATAKKIAKRINHKWVST